MIEVLNFCCNLDLLIPSIVVLYGLIGLVVTLFQVPVVAEVVYTSYKRSGRKDVRIQHIRYMFNGIMFDDVKVNLVGKYKNGAVLTVFINPKKPRLVTHRDTCWFYVIFGLFILLFFTIRRLYFM